MKVKELIDELKKYDPEAAVVTEKADGNGCDTCGYGETSTEMELSNITDLETRIVLNFEY